MKELKPDEAEAMVRDAPERIVFPISTFALQFGLTNDELLEDLRSGALVACHNAQGTIVVTLMAAGEWLDSSTAASVKARLNMSAPSRQ